MRLSRRDLLQLAAGAPLATLPRRAGAQAQPLLLTRGLFLHVWDLQDEGVDRVLGWMKDSGLNQMLIAGSYHSGWFVHPRKDTRRGYITQGGVPYFPPHP